MEKTSRLSPYFRLSTVTDNRLVAQGSTSGVTNYGYDAVGNLSGYTYPNGVQTSYNYDGLNRLTQMGSAKSGPLSSYVYTLGAAGNRLTVAELSGRTVNYGYDSLYRLTSEAVTADPHNNNVTNGYLYDSVGNRQQWLINGATVNTYTYDADDRLGADQYDADGNTINSLGTANSYDFENHLVQHGTVAIVYDGDGNRVSETVGGVTTDYLVDTVNPTGYAQVVDELVSGAVTRTYAYGLERISESQTLNATWTPSFYGYDGHGSVRQLTNAAGAVTDSYDYDAFGNLINSTGSTPNNYLFAGEQYDSALGLYYNRARYYNNTAGLFWTADTDEGDDETPLSLNKYLYTNANPVDGTDPSGFQDSMGELGAEESMSATLDAMPTLNFNAVVNAAIPITPYPPTLAQRQLVGVVFAESSTPNKGGAEYPDEKEAIVQTFYDEAYYATLSPRWNSSFGDGTLWTAIKLNSQAAQDSTPAWSKVMDGNTPSCDLRDSKILNNTLNDRLTRTHFWDSVLAVENFVSTQAEPVPALSGRIPVNFNKARNTPPNRGKRMERIGRIGATTFYGFKWGRELQ